MKKIRVGVRRLLLSVFALIIAILFTTSRLIVSSSLSHHNHSNSHKATNVVPTVDVAPSMELLNIEEGHENKTSIIGGYSSLLLLDGKNSSTTFVDEKKNSFHFIVSSDCTSYQRWETLVQLHSAQAIHQCGRFTWIVSGCLEEESGHVGKGKGGANSDILTPDSLLNVVESHFKVTISNHPTRTTSIAAQEHNNDCSTNYPHVHFTPDYSNMSVYGGPYADGKKKRSFLNRHGKVMTGNFGNTYKFNNKPNGLHHWAEYFLKQDDRRDEAIVLIDPDFLFLNIFELPKGAPPVQPGVPAAAKYGLGGQFLEFNSTRICDSAAPLVDDIDNSMKLCPFVSLTNFEVNRYYSAGPPYVIHIQDVLPLSRRWSELVPKTFDEYPLLYAEMFAYSMAAADLGLRHELLKDLFTGCMTHWPMKNQYSDDAVKLSANIYASIVGRKSIDDQNNEGASSCFLPPLSPPPFLHYCSRYSFATPYPAEEVKGQQYYFFAKRKVDHDILDCRKDQPLEPFISGKPEKIEGGNKDWNVLAVCAIIRSINFASRKGCD